MINGGDFIECMLNENGITSIDDVMKELGIQMGSIKSTTIWGLIFHSLINIREF
jgi:hypothetical protein